MSCVQSLGAGVTDKIPLLAAILAGAGHAINSLSLSTCPYRIIYVKSYARLAMVYLFLFRLKKEMIF